MIKEVQVEQVERIVNQIYSDNYFNNLHIYAYPDGLSATSISDISGMPRATVMRKLDYLKNNGLLAQNEKKQYNVKNNYKDLYKKLIGENKIMLTDFLYKGINLIKDN